MTYIPSNQKNKLATAVLEQNKQANDVSLQQWVKGKIDNQVNSINPSNTVISNTNMNSPWYLVDQAQGIYGTVDQKSIYKTWRIDMGELNISYLDYFKFEIVTKNGENGEKDTTGFTPAWTFYSDYLFFFKFWGWDIKDIVGSETSNVKKISLVVSYAYYRQINFPDFQSKLLIQYCNQGILI